MEIVALVGAGDTSSATSAALAHRTLEGQPGTGRGFRDVREVYWFTARGGRIVEEGALEDNDDRRRQLRVDNPV